MEVTTSRMKLSHQCLFVAYKADSEHFDDLSVHQDTCLIIWRGRVSWVSWGRIYNTASTPTAPPQPCCYHLETRLSSPVPLSFDDILIKMWCFHKHKSWSRSILPPRASHPPPRSRGQPSGARGGGSGGRRGARAGRAQPCRAGRRWGRVWGVWRRGKAVAGRHGGHKKAGRGWAAQSGRSQPPEVGESSVGTAAGQQWRAWGRRWRRGSAWGSCSWRCSYPRRWAPAVGRGWASPPQPSRALLSPAVPRSRCVPSGSGGSWGSGRRHLAALGGGQGSGGGGGAVRCLQSWANLKKKMSWGASRPCSEPHLGFGGGPGV